MQSLGGRDSLTTVLCYAQPPISFTDKENGFGQALCGSDLALGQSKTGTQDSTSFYTVI